MKQPSALLALEDGRVWRGTAFGALSNGLGEVCFNTSMTGYQEVLTDPSYRGQIVVMTYPLIGNYGINDQDFESDCPQVSGFVVREVADIASNWRSRESLPHYLERVGIPGIQGVDTRSITKHLRTRGAMRGVITTEAISDAAAADLAKSFSYLGRDFVQEVTCSAPYDWDPDGSQSRRWKLTLGTGATEQEHGLQGRPDDYFEPLPPVKHRIVAYDFGIKRNILRRLRQHGFSVWVVPASTSPEAVLALDPEGVFFSPGPGDPAELTYGHAAARGLAGKKPIFGICLGHQMLAYAFGGKTFKLKFGHRGGNQPVQDVRTGRVEITSQNHGFAVDAATLPENQLEVSHINLNDGTCEGLRHKKWPIFSIQYHPEAAPGPHDATHFFAEFSKMIEHHRATP
jgi:carbamoyl-phosphate synthase small subunit